MMTARGFSFRPAFSLLSHVQVGVRSAAYFWPPSQQPFHHFSFTLPLWVRAKVCRGKSSFAHISARAGRTCRSLRFVMPFCTVWKIQSPSSRLPVMLQSLLFFSFFPNQGCTIADPTLAQSTFPQFVRLQAGAGWRDILFELHLTGELN